MKYLLFSLKVVLISSLYSCCNCETPENEVGRYIPWKTNYWMILDTKTSKIYHIKDGGKTYYIDVVNNKSSGKWVEVK
jgi:hypothetical protein